MNILEGEGVVLLFASRGWNLENGPQQGKVIKWQKDISKMVPFEQVAREALPVKSFSPQVHVAVLESHDY